MSTTTSSTRAGPAHTADATALAHDLDLGQAHRHVHEHIADTLADLLRRGQTAGDVRDDIHSRTAAWCLVSLLAGRSSAPPSPPTTSTSRRN